MQIFNQYKQGRVIKEKNNVKYIFKKVFDDNMFNSCNIEKVLYLNNLEADDCIALKYFVKKILNTEPDSKIWIITSDMDYLQLARDNVKLYNLKFKDLTDSKSSFKNAEKDLFYKIIMGDKSDNINKVFERCGKKFEEYWNDKKKFEEVLRKK